MVKQLSAVDDNDRYKYGWRFEKTLPNQNIDNEDGKSVSAGNDYVNFEPNWDQAGSPTFADLAFVTYRLSNLAGYAGDRRLRFGWKTEPDNWEDFWVGIGDFDRNKWDWYQGPEYPEGLTIPTLTDRISPAGDMLITVAFTGTGCPTLDYVLLGETIYEIDITTSTDHGLPDLDVDFNVKAEVIGGIPATYDFDFDSDGTWEVTGNTTGLENFTYTVSYVGNQTATIRVNTVEGESCTATQDILVIDPANIAPTASLIITPTVGNAPLLVECDASGSGDTDGTIIKYEWDVNGDGTYDFDTGDSPYFPYNYGYSILGTIYVRVTDNNLATNEACQDFNVQNGWLDRNIDLNVTMNAPPSIGSSGTLMNYLPTVAYRNYNSGSTNAIRFCRATDPDGSGWSTVYDVVTGTDQGYGLEIAAFSPLIGQSMPSFFYCSEASGNRRLMYCPSQNTGGTAWDPPVAVSSTLDAGGRNAYISVGMRPAVITDNDGTLVSIRATNTVGTTWGTPVTIDTAPASGYITSPQPVWCGEGDDYLPHVFYLYVSYDPPLVSMRMAKASNDQASGWETPVTVFNGIDPDTWNPAISAMVVNNKPAIAFVNSENNSSLYYIQAADADGDTWNAPVLVDSGNVGYTATLVYWSAQSKPVIGYFDEDNKVLKAAMGTDSDGTAWDEPMYIQPIGRGSRFIDMRVYGNYVGMAFYDPLPNNDLKWLYWEGPQ